MKRAILVVLLWLLPATALADGHAEAVVHFERGVALVDAKAWQQALSEFERSLALEPTRTATQNAAICLRELHRFDEAADAYEKLLRDFGRSLAPAERASIEEDGARMRRFTGELLVTGPAGAAIFVDDRPRGTLPAGALRVSVGTRVVRVELGGFLSRAEKVTVVSGERASLDVKLEPLAERGTLVVREAAGKPLDVRVDSAVVGRSPWTGAVSTGEHTVALRGAGDFGAEPRAVVVRTNATTAVTLAAHMLPGELRVEPTPPSATVFVDGRARGTGTFDGMLPSGAHDVEVEAPWHVARRERVVVSAAQPVTVRVVLEPVSRVFVDGIAGFIVLPSYSASATCGTLDPNCLGWAFAVRGGYHVAARVAVELTYYAVAVIRRYDAATDSGVFLSGGVVSASYRFFDRFPLLVRLGAGVSREHAAGEGFTPLVVPEVAIGWRFAPSLRADLGVSALVFVLQSGGNYGGGLGAAFPVTLALHGDL